MVHASLIDRYGYLSLPGPVIFIVHCALEIQNFELSRPKGSCKKMKGEKASGAKKREKLEANKE